MPVDVIQNTCATLFSFLVDVIHGTQNVKPNFFFKFLTLNTKKSAYEEKNTQFDPIRGVVSNATGASSLFHTIPETWRAGVQNLLHAINFT